jgi:methyltransferase (TIGR00027 family)
MQSDGYDHSCNPLTTVQRGKQSRTAEYVALFRALETARPEAERLFNDPLATAFLTGRLRAVAALATLPGLDRLVPALIDRRWPGPRASAIARTRVIDDVLHDAPQRGLDQLVLLGAGYDSRPYRLADTGTLRVFEVDHPTTQAVKRRVLEKALGHPPAHVCFVPPTSTVTRSEL